MGVREGRWSLFGSIHRIAGTPRGLSIVAGQFADEYNRDDRIQLTREPKGEAMKRIATAAGFASIVVGMAASIRADDDADPTGIWNWVADATAETIELSLKRDGDKLTGALFHYNSEFPRLPKSGQAEIRRNVTIRISDGMIQDGRISFKIVRSFNGRKNVLTYTGKIEGNLIRGKIQIGSQSRDWEAKRADH